MGSSGQDTPGAHGTGAASEGDPIDVRISQLEAQMSDLQSRHPGSFAIAAAWADRHDAILAATPPERLDEVRARLRRIGIRWGVVSGPRVTQEITALPAQLPLHRRRPPKR